MGNCYTSDSNEHKPKKKVSLKPRQSHLDMNLTMGDENDGGEMSQKKYDEIEVAKMKKELLETPQIFVLNNMLMSIMFFENFEK